jgi:hypothetical protein
VRRGSGQVGKAVDRHGGGDLAPGAQKENRSC